MDDETREEVVMEVARVVEIECEVGESPDTEAIIGQALESVEQFLDEVAPR